VSQGSHLEHHPKRARLPWNVGKVEQTKPGANTIVSSGTMYTRHPCVLTLDLSRHVTTPEPLELVSPHSTSSTSLSTKGSSLTRNTAWMRLTTESG